MILILGGFKRIKQANTSVFLGQEYSPRGLSVPTTGEIFPQCLVFSNPHLTSLLDKGNQEAEPSEGEHRGPIG